MAKRKKIEGFKIHTPILIAYLEANGYRSMAKLVITNGHGALVEAMELNKKQIQALQEKAVTYHVNKG